MNETEALKLSWRGRLQETKYWLVDRRAEKLLLWFVDLLPKEIVYRATIRLWAHATTGRWGNTEVTSLSIDEALKRWWQSPHDPRDTL